MSLRVHPVVERWLLKINYPAVGPTTSAIRLHHVKSGHKADLERVYWIVYHMSINHSEVVRLRPIPAVQTISIQLAKPRLYTHNRFAYALNVSWSHTHTNTRVHTGLTRQSV